MNSNASKFKIQSIVMILFLLLSSTTLSLKLESPADDAKILAKVDFSKTIPLYDFPKMTMEERTNFLFERSYDMKRF